MDRVYDYKLYFQERVTKLLFAVTQNSSFWLMSVYTSLSL